MMIDAWALEIRTAYAHQEFGSRVRPAARWRPLNTYRRPPNAQPDDGYPQAAGFRSGAVLRGSKRLRYSCTAPTAHPLSAGTSRRRLLLRRATAGSPAHSGHFAASALPLSGAGSPSRARRMRLIPTAAANATIAATSAVAASTSP